MWEDGPPLNLFDLSGYRPANRLPENCALVVRTVALQEFESRIREAEKSGETPLKQRERDTLLTMIKALIRVARLEKSKIVSVIHNETLLMGTPVSGETIRNKLDLIPEALERKSKDRSPN